MHTITVDGRAIAYRDTGSGPPVLLAHCSSASHREWNPLIERLRGRYRLLAPDLIGYGRSDPLPGGAPLEPDAEVNVLRHLTAIAGQPLHLVGHSYGAAVALEAARVLGDRVRSLTLIEPVSFHLLQQPGAAAEWSEISALADRIRTAVARGRPDRATAAYMGFWIGRLRWWVMPRRQQRGIVATVAKVAAEFAMIERLPTTLAEYAAITAPALLIAGARTRRPARAVVDLLASALPDAQLHILPGAGHMSPFTHAQAIVDLIGQHLAQCERRPGAFE